MSTKAYARYHEDTYIDYIFDRGKLVFTLWLYVHRLYVTCFASACRSNWQAKNDEMTRKGEVTKKRAAIIDASNDR